MGTSASTSSCVTYTVSFTNDAVITFIDCSGFTQTLSGSASTDYLICGQAPTIPPSGVSYVSNGPSTNIFFSSCCGNYFFYGCIPNSYPLGTGLTYGAEYIQFSDGTFAENKCFFYENTLIPPVGVNVPYIVASQLTGRYIFNGSSCENCLNSSSIEDTCPVTYFKYCCCEYDTPEPPIDCYFSVYGKGLPTVNPGVLFFITTSGGTTFCAEGVNPNEENFYSVTEFKYPTEITSVIQGNDDDTCLTCVEQYPCLGPTPTPTPTKTPVPTPLPRTKNECEPIDIYNMEVSCVVLQPSTFESNDGAASLKITGGTPPYTIIWDNGNISPAIGNLKVGSYGATVVDFYKDFTAKTVCVLTGVTIPTTPTPTPSPSPIPVGEVFCFSLRFSYLKNEQPFDFTMKETFSVDSFINGQPSWVSSSSSPEFRVYWEPSAPSRWILSGSTLPFPVTNPQINPAIPPTNANDWSVLGGPVIINSKSIVLGPCNTGLFMISPFAIESPSMVLYNVKSDPVCGCDGSIIIDASEGNPPYLYSIDNGVSYSNFPIFDNLCSGVYTVTVKDNLDFTKSSVLKLENPTDPTTYVVTLSKGSNTIIDNGTVFAKTTNVVLNVSPPLPDYATITFDIIHNNTFKTSTTQNSGSLTCSTVLSKNEIPISYTTTAQTTGSEVNIKNGCQDQLIYITGTSEIWKGLTLTSTDTLIINTSTSILKNFTTGCDLATSEENYSVTNLKITGCQCCRVQNTLL